MDATANRLELNKVGMDYAPLWFQHTQDIFIYSSAILWSFAYIFYIRQAFRDQSYGMPIVSLLDPKSTDLSMYTNTNQVANDIPRTYQMRKCHLGSRIRPRSRA